MIAIIDYDAGNIKSVEKALISLGEDAVITRDKCIVASLLEIISKVSTAVRRCQNLSLW